MLKGLSNDRITDALNQFNKQPIQPKESQQLTGGETWVFKVLFGSLFLSLILAPFSKYGWQVRAFSIGLLGFAELGFWGMSAWVGWTGFKSANQTVTALSKRNILFDAEQIMWCEKLSCEEIDFLSQRMRLNAEHLRSRIAFLVGPFDKTGAVPLAVATAWALVKMPEVTQAQMPYIIVALAGLTLLYLEAMVLAFRSHRIDECAQVLELAVSKDDASASEVENAD